MLPLSRFGGASLPAVFATQRSRYPRSCVVTHEAQLVGVFVRPNGAFREPLLKKLFCVTGRFLPAHLHLAGFSLAVEGVIESFLFVNLAVMNMDRREEDFLTVRGGKSKCHGVERKRH